MNNLSNENRQYDFIVVGAGAAGSVLCCRIVRVGRAILVIESGWARRRAYYCESEHLVHNVGGPLDFHLPSLPRRELKQSRLQHGARSCTGRRQQHQRYGVDPRHAA